MDPLVLLHGLNNTPAVWATTVPALAARMAVPPLVITPELACLETVEAVADALLADLPERFAVAGFSFGGYVALAMLERAPQRIARFALVCSTTRADSDATRTVREKTIAALKAGRFEQVLAAQFPLAVHPTRHGDPAVAGPWFDGAREYGAQRLIAHTGACMARPDRTEVLAAYRGETMLLAAADDRLIPAEGIREVAQRVGAERYDAVPGSGHLLPLEQPAALAVRLSRWLEQGERE